MWVVSLLHSGFVGRMCVYTNKAGGKREASTTATWIGLEKQSAKFPDGDHTSRSQNNFLREIQLAGPVTLRHKTHHP